MISEAIALVTLLAEHFKVAPPNLAICAGDKSLYHPPSRTIFLAASPWRGMTNSVLHEFAHVLAFGRNPFHLDEHGQPFQEALVEVAAFHYGDPKHYDWTTEYESVRTFAVRRLD